MGEQVFLLPDLGEGLTEAEILQWRVAVGDIVEIDQTVVEVETAKAAVDVPCPYAGRVVALHGEPGEVRPVGQPLITIAPVGAGPDSPAGDEPPGHAVYREEERAGSGNVLVGYGTGHGRSGRRRRPRTVPAQRSGAASGIRTADVAGSETVPAQGRPAPAGGLSAVVPAGGGPTPAPVDGADQPGDGRPAPVATTGWRTDGADGTPGTGALVISPLVRRFARENGVDVAALRGSGPGGIIRRADVVAALAAADPARPGAGAAGVSSPPGTALTAGGGGEPGSDDVVIPLRGVRRVIADKLSRSRREIPEVTIWVDADATELLATRATINAARPQRPVSLLALFARICVHALRRFPQLNSRVDVPGERIVQSGRIHLGIAAQTDRGLLVPVITDAQARTTSELARELAEVTAAARAGTLPPARLTGGTFTLNNYGVFGVDGSTPIINLPESGLLGIGRIIDRPWAVDGQLAVRKVVQLSLTFDHRVCDGGVAGGFLRLVADCVERPALFIADV